MSSQTHGGDIVASVLHRKGTEHIFTLCGGHISPILIGANSLGIRVIDVRHEATAIFAADAVTRLTDKPGVSTVTAGPGLTNTITAVKNAQMAQSPVILLGGGTATVLKNKGALQDIDQMALMRPHVKWASTINRISQIEETLEKAFKIAQDRVSGPVFIEFPVDILYPEQTVREWYGLSSEEEKPRIERYYLNWHVNRLFKKNIFPKKLYRPPKIMVPRQNQVKKSAVMIQSAKKPVLLISSQAMLSANNVPNLKDAVIKMGIPTYLSGMARGLLPPDEKNFFRHKRSDALNESDLVILAGASFDFRLAYGKKIPSATPVISINRNPNELKLNRQPTLGILADPSLTLVAIASLRSNINDSWNVWHTLLKERETIREEEIIEQSEYKNERINPIALLKSLDKLLSDNTIFVADGGDFVASASYIINPRKELSWLDPGPFGTLGAGAGFALGAKLSKPDSDICILYGDGSVGYSLAEFDTFLRHNIPIIALVGNDAGWTQIKREQVNIFQNDLATTLRTTDYHTVAIGYGGKGLLLKSLNKFEQVINESLSIANSGQPVLINAVLGKTDFRKGSLSI